MKSQNNIPSNDAKKVPVAFVGGGQMASALIGGLIRAGWAATDIYVVEPHEPQQVILKNRFGVHVVAQPEPTLHSTQVVIWAVKPQILRQAASSMGDHVADPLHISIVAGVSLRDLAICLHSDRIVRAMPNTPALVGAGTTGMFASDDLIDGDRKLAESILASSGRVFWVTSDAQMDAVTAVSGSGPAYVFKFLESFQAAAQDLGFASAEARTLVLDTVAGAVQLAQAEDTGFTELRQRVTSKNGTTEAAIAVFENRGFDSMIKDAVVTARDRAIAISSDLSIVLTR